MTANDPDLPGDTLTYGATGLPAGISIDSATGEISGKIAYDAYENGPSYSVTVTVSDATNPTPQQDSTAFVWTITNFVIVSLSGTEYYGANTELPNSITVYSVTSETLYVGANSAPTQFVELSVAIGTPAPDMDDVLFTVSGPASPTSGNFGTDPTPMIAVGPAASYHWVKVGLDANGDGVLSSVDGEVSHRFKIKVISFTDAKVMAQRVAPTKWAEDLLPLKDGEVFDIGSTFSFELHGPHLGDPSMIRWELWDTDLLDELIAEGSGTTFERQFSNAGAEPGDAYIRFYVDVDGSEDYDQLVDYSWNSPSLVIKERNLVTMEYWVSSAIPEFAGKTEPQRRQMIMDQINKEITAIQVKDDEWDWRGVIEVVIQPKLNPIRQSNGNPDFMGIFDPDADHPDPVLSGSQPQFDAVMDLTDGNDFALINDLQGPVAGVTPWIGAGRFIADWQKSSGPGDITLLHELGHSIGIGHTDLFAVEGPTAEIRYQRRMRHIMIGIATDKIQTLLLKSEADSFSGL